MNSLKPGHNSKNDDCYFYYYGSGCAKANTCPFRHEPTALAQETVCLFWKNGNCTKPHCMFRHMDIAKKRNVIPCYWEKTTTGCQKAHCPFLHDKPKDSPLTEPIHQKSNPNDVSSATLKSAVLSTQTNTLENSIAMKAQPDVSKIIVNKNKLNELKNNHVIPQNVSVFDPVKARLGPEAENKNESNRVVLPPKQRLGIKVEVTQGKKRSVKDRLGAIINPKHNCAIYELDEGDSLLDDIDTDISHEEKLLREGAIKTIDLRNRLSKKETLTFSRENQLESIIRAPAHHMLGNQQPADTMSDRSFDSGPESYHDSDEEEYDSPKEEEYDSTKEEYDSPTITKKVKKHKKEKKKKEKSKKKEKKEKKLEKLKQKKLKAEKAKKRIGSKHKVDNASDDTNVSEIVPEELEPEDISSLESYVRNLKKERNKMLQNEIDALVSEQVDQNEEDKTDKHKHSTTGKDNKRLVIANSKNLIQAKQKAASKGIDIQKGKIVKSKASTKGSALQKTSYSNKRAKLLKDISTAVVKKKESVRSVLNDVDSLLKSAEDQNLLNCKDTIQAESDDVMKQLDEIINS